MAEVYKQTKEYLFLLVTLNMSEFVCNVCIKKFARKFNYKRHESTCLRRLLKCHSYNKICHHFDNHYKLMFWQRKCSPEDRFIFWKDDLQPNVINMVKVKV